jgi:polyvinyl alcohol dehydrogenase (cytochrome)
MKHIARRGVPLAAFAIVASLFVGAPASAAGTCAAAAHPGGDWPSLGQDLSNSRSQPLETTIGTTNVGTLTAAWEFNPADQAATGQIQSTPVVAEGCVYITTSSGWVFALDADTGALAWNRRVEETVAEVCCGGTLFAPAVRDGVAYINVSHNPTSSTDHKGPYVIALNSQTGDVIWKSEQVAWEDGAYTNSSAVYFDGMIFIGISNPEMDANQTGGFALVDASSACSAAGVAICTTPVTGATGGTIIKRTRTIPDDQWAAGYGGGSIWSTPAIDPVAKFAFVGTGQPSPWMGNESEFTNAMIKIDLDRTRATFGEIVGARKGQWDSEVRPDMPIPYIDVDMAASPTLYTDATGQQMVAALQKSGWVHAGYTRHMSNAWSIPVAPYGFALGNYASTATDGKGNIFAHGTYPGQVFSLNGTTGLPNWVAPAITVLGANPPTYTNGVVYLADGKGFLNAFDATTGVLLLHRPMLLDAGAVCLNAGGGVSIARNTVYAVCGDGEVGFSIGPTDAAPGWLIAYRLPA